jgi:hypothetical protein
MVAIVIGVTIAAERATDAPALEKHPARVTIGA